MSFVQSHHTDGMISGVDMQHFAGNSHAQIRQQSQSRTADFVLSDVAFQRRIQFVPTQDFAEIADTGSGQRLNRAGGNCIDADILHAEVNGGVADGGIKRGLGNAIIL